MREFGTYTSEVFIAYAVNRAVKSLTTPTVSDVKHHLVRCRQGWLLCVPNLEHIINDWIQRNKGMSYEVSNTLLV